MSKLNKYILFMLNITTEIAAELLKIFLILQENKYIQIIKMRIRNFYISL